MPAVGVMDLVIRNSGSGVHGVTIRTRRVASPGGLFAVLADDFILTASMSRDVACPDPIVHDFGQGSHIGQAGSDNTDGRLNACPDTWVDLVAGNILARSGKANEGSTRYFRWNNNNHSKWN